MLTLIIGLFCFAAGFVVSAFSRVLQAEYRRQRERLPEMPCTPAAQDAPITARYDREIMRREIVYNAMYNRLIPAEYDPEQFAWLQHEAADRQLERERRGFMALPVHQVGEVCKN